MAIDFTPTIPQAKLLQSTAKYPLFCAGFGAGKSEALHVRAILDLVEANNPSTMVGIYSATFDLLRLNNIPRMEELVEKVGFSYHLNKSEFTLSIKGLGMIIFRSLDNPARIVAFQHLTGHVDELDTLPPVKAREAFEKILGRNRQKIGNLKNRLSVYTTPEGFGFCYDTWVRNKPSDDYQIIQAPTSSNPYLPTDYIDSLKAQYPSHLIDAYLDGQFVNMTSGAVYPAFDREAARSSEVVQGRETLHIGMDFNVGFMSAAVGVERPSGLHIVDEFFGLYDTNDMIDSIRSKYTHNPVIVYPDASGANRNTATLVTDHVLLKKAGFRLRVDNKNPLIANRVQAVNKALEDQNLWINDSTARNISDGLEQQVFDERTGKPQKGSGFALEHVIDGLGYLVIKRYPIVKPRPPRIR